ncbi:MAG TPA: DNA repair protein RadA [Spirochaetota bacterium]|nr:DNA repair protein RadA [Spirochaetota bacterium]HQE58284.1 DNA repair protein RadA [Spirochaetota bacterium]
MAKKDHFFLCSNCGEKSPKWLGKCPSCGDWNSFVEENESTKEKKIRQHTHLLSLSEIGLKDSPRFATGISEFDAVCGGGIVKGSVILIGGEPGIGKSTLSLQIASSLKTLYISGEESPEQIKQRADRLKLNTSKIFISTERSVEAIEHILTSQKFETVIIDSIQTVFTENNPSAPGSVSQIRESAASLTESAKKTNIPFIIVGHITKEGTIAGPKILEHIVDTVLYFEGDFTKEYRLLKSFKNRFGSVNEIGIFKMTPGGLFPVEDRNSIFLNPNHLSSPGSSVSAALEGSRIILFEVQSLVTPTNFSNPKRMADGFDQNRLSIISAVLEKYLKIPMSSSDIFINLAGGFSVGETASDTAIAVSIISSYLNKSVDKKTGFVGEISLSGEIRPVSHIERRISELYKNGFSRVSVPFAQKDDIDAKGGLQILPAVSVKDLVSFTEKNS